MRLLQRPAELCVDFGFDSAFAIEIEHGSIVRWTTWALPSGSFRQGEAVDTNRLGDQMCAALDEADPEPIHRAFLAWAFDGLFPRPLAAVNTAVYGRLSQEAA